MNMNKAVLMFNYLDKSEEKFCTLLNRVTFNPFMHEFFWLISRLGNGVFWYILMLILPLIYGPSAIPVVIQMVVTALVGVIIYKILKKNLVRQRPFITHNNIKLGTAPLDEYSFPSGHTLHAVSFSYVLLASYPEFSLLVIPFAILTALSRPILGLHYPSDVAVGALIGWIIAFISLSIY